MNKEKKKKKMSNKLKNILETEKNQKYRLNEKVYLC